MNPRQLKAIFAALAVLVAAYAAVQLWSGSGGTAGDQSIPDAVRDGIGLVRVIGPGDADSVRLEGSEGSWTVNGYPADTSMVTRLRQGLDSATVGRLVARSAANHARLGVDEESARRVEIGPVSDPAVTFFLGGGGADGRFVRFPPAEEVFAVPAASVRLLTRSVEEWRDHVVAEADTAGLIRIAVRRADEEAQAVLTRATGEAPSGWTLAGEAADSAVVQQMLDESAQLTATGFPSDAIAFAADFSNPVAVLEMFDSDEPGAPPALSLLFLTAPDAPEFLVRRADDPLAYRISAAQAERLLPTREMLLGGVAE